MTTRRGVFKKLLLFAPLAPSLTWGWNERFWNVKDPAAWNEKEIEEIATRSPWAKQALVQPQNYAGPDTNMSGIESGGGPRRGTGEGGMIGRSQGGGNYSAEPTLHVRVRWESALPVSAALKLAAPEATQFYVLSLSGLPLRARSEPADAAENRRLGIEEAFKEATSLVAKNKEVRRPVRVELAEADGVAFLRFQFAREPHPIRLEDKEITFSSVYSGLIIKARFSLKEMIYHGQLAL